MNFDPTAFLNVEIAEPTVRRPPVAPGDYLATIGEVTAKSWQSESKGTSGMRYVVPLKVEVPADQQPVIGTPTITLTDSIMLDLNEQGGLDLGVGRNGGLRRYREAVDMNKPGDVFSPAKMQGRMVKVKLTHDLYQGEIQERVGGVSKA